MAAAVPGPAAERLLGTAAAVSACVLGGAHIVRVHDVREMRDVVRVCDAIRGDA
jgi:dihydropteroate synthase